MAVPLDSCDIEAAVYAVWSAERFGGPEIDHATAEIGRCIEGIDADRVWWYRGHAALNRRDFVAAAHDFGAIAVPGDAYGDLAVLFRVHALVRLVEQRHGGVDAVDANARVLRHGRTDVLELSAEHAALIDAADIALAWSYHAEMPELPAGDLSRAGLMVLPARILYAHGHLHDARERTWTMLGDPSVACAPATSDAMVMLLDSYGREGRGRALERARADAIAFRAGCFPRMEP